MLPAAIPALVLHHVEHSASEFLKRYTFMRRPVEKPVDGVQYPGARRVRDSEGVGVLAPLKVIPVFGFHIQLSFEKTFRDFWAGEYHSWLPLNNP
jgi:hypothetical protein